MGKVDDISERLTIRGIAALGVLAVAVPLAGTIVAQGIVDGILGAIAVVGGLLSGVVLARRRALDSLPLELSRVALRGEVDGVPVVKVRARLGRGRVARDPVVTVSFRGADGGDVSLPVVLPASLVCGAFTITAVDRQRVTLGPGAVSVRVEVRSSGRTWSADRTFPTLAEGRFAAPVLRARGRLAHDRDRWEAVEP